MKIHVADHPLITHKLTVLRDEKTNSPTFRQLTEELVTLLAYEATREVKTVPLKIKTPVAETTGRVLAKPRPVVVPILRAGLGMLEGMTRLIPTAEVIDTSGIKESGDCILKRDGKDSILFETTEYDTNVNPDEVKKFIRDCDIQKSHGIFLSQISELLRFYNKKKSELLLL